jgi:hypothetical protein
MFPIRIALERKNVCFVYIFKHMIKVYLNLEIGINICIFIIQIEVWNRFLIIQIRKPSDVFSKNIGALAPAGRWCISVSKKGGQNYNF